MSRHAAAGQMDEVKDDASLANRLSIVALTPIAAGIMVLAGALAIVASLYGAVGLDETVVLGTHAGRAGARPGAVRGDPGADAGVLRDEGRQDPGDDQR